SELLGFSVLIVNEDEDVREQLRLCFKHKGCIVFAADRGDRAFALWKLNKPDVVITELEMISSEGEILLKRIDQESASERPVMICTSGCSKVRTYTAYDFGADAFFQKPFDLKNLVS